MTRGYNPMRWNCDVDGCFNVSRRPKIEVFAGCFPRRINFGDVDGLVEMSGFLCFLEWKGIGGSLKLGQIRTFKAITRTLGNVVFVIDGDAETMDVSQYCTFWNGAQTPWVKCGLESVRARIKGWADWVENSARGVAV